MQRMGLMRVLQEITDELFVLQILFIIHQRFSRFLQIHPLLIYEMQTTLSLLPILARTSPISLPDSLVDEQRSRIYRLDSSEVLLGPSQKQSSQNGIHNLDPQQHFLDIQKILLV
jgi:hypothetical protein